MQRGPAWQPAAWYGAAVFLALCGAGVAGLAVFAAHLRPGFPSDLADWAIIGFAALLFLVASACAWLGRALGRRAPWADVAVPWLLAAHALLGIVSLAGLVAKSLGWI